jgi:hypothetical protein
MQLQRAQSVKPPRSICVAATFLVRNSLEESHGAIFAAAFVEEQGSAIRRAALALTSDPPRMAFTPPLSLRP